MIKVGDILIIKDIVYYLRIGIGCVVRIEKILNYSNDVYYVITILETTNKYNEDLKGKQWRIPKDTKFEYYQFLSGDIFYMTEEIPY